MQSSERERSTNHELQPPAPPPANAGAEHGQTYWHKIERRYHALLHIAKQVIWTTNRHGHAEEDMPTWRAHTGQSAEEIRGQGWLEAIHPEDREHLLHFWAQPAPESSLYEAEQRIRRADGVYHTFLVRAAPTHDTEGHVQEWVGFCTDITESSQMTRRTEEARANALALREANRRMDEFLGIASHELKTPLTGLRMGIQLAERRLHRSLDDVGSSVSDLAAQIKGLERLLTRTEYQASLLGRLVDDLLNVSRIQAGKLELRPTLVNLATIVRDTVQAERLLVPSRTINVQALPAQPVQVMADADGIGEVITNYLTNALKYSQEERPVEVGLEVEGQHARVWMRDQGPGLRPAEQARIWERFQRAPGIEVQSGSGVGLGLGLYISKNIVERLNGRVGVQSAPGKGSTFWFTLPLAEG